jgi:hypothetical protein
MNVQNGRVHALFPQRQVTGLTPGLETQAKLQEASHEHSERMVAQSAAVPWRSFTGTQEIPFEAQLEGKNAGLVSIFPSQFVSPPELRHCAARGKMSTGKESLFQETNCVAPGCASANKSQQSHSPSARAAL